MKAALFGLVLLGAPILEAAPFAYIANTGSNSVFGDRHKAPTW